jgi:Ca2+-binding RTX toxin-like protein
MATIKGGSGDDGLFGTKAADKIFGFAGADFIAGASGDDLLVAGSEEDYVQGENGNDRILGESGDDTLIGGNGADQIDGGTEHDQLFGGASRDWLAGGTGYDELYGQDANDRLMGGDSDDSLQGGAGDDILLGGPGFDTFFYDAFFVARPDDDLIGDFEKDVDIIIINNDLVRFEDLFYALDSNDSGRLDAKDRFIDIAPVAFEGSSRTSTVIDVGGLIAEELGQSASYKPGDDTLTVFGVTGLDVNQIAGDF